MADSTLLSGDLRLAGRLDGRFFELLEALHATGSINRAARAAGYTYKGAWLILESAAKLAHEPLVERVVGGRGGGGTRLTPASLGLLTAWRHLQTQQAAFLRQQEAWLTQQPALAGLLRSVSMKTTARNQFAGSITAIESGPVTTQVCVQIAGGHEVVATLTSKAAERLKLALGKAAIVMIKSSALVLVTDFGGYALSARNQFAGTLSRVERGAVSSLVVVTLPGGMHLTASVTNDAVDALALEGGEAACAVLKAYSVMVSVAED